MKRIPYIANYIKKIIIQDSAKEKRYGLLNKSFESSVFSRAISNLSKSTFITESAEPSDKDDCYPARTSINRVSVENSTIETSIIETSDGDDFSCEGATWITKMVEPNDSDGVCCECCEGTVQKVPSHSKNNRHPI
jgi:hypothetical protein